MAGFDLDAAVDELYGAPREEFVGVRKALAARAKGAGDAKAARTIAGLGKPTSAAWVANQLARSDPEAVAALIDLGDQLRDATARLDGAALRSLSQDRSAAVRTLARRAAELTRPSAAVARELEEILTAAVSDPAVGALLVAGRLASAKGSDAALDWPTGVTRPRPVPVEPPALADETPAPPRAERRTRPSAAHTKAQRALDEARAAVKQAEADRATRHRELEGARAAVEAAGARIRELSDELTRAESTQRQARAAEKAARQAAKEADRSTSEAWRRVQEAEESLARATD